MSATITYVDQETYNRCLKKIEETEAELSALRKRKEELATHLQKGDDWHENPVLSQIEMQQQLVLDRLNKLQEKKATFYIVDNQEDGVVRIGNTITLLLNDEDDQDDEAEEFCVLLVVTEPKRKTDGIVEISKDTALGRAIIGKKVNDTVTYIGNNNNKITVNILKIQ